MEKRSLYKEINMTFKYSLTNIIVGKEAGEHKKLRGGLVDGKREVCCERRRRMHTIYMTMNPPRKEKKRFAPFKEFVIFLLW